MVYSGSDDGTIKIWNTRTYENLYTLDVSFDRSVWALCANADFLFSGSGNGTITLWNRRVMGMVKQVNAMDTNSGVMGVWGLAVYGDMLFVGTANVVKIFSVPDLVYIGDLNGSLLTDGPDAGYTRSIVISKSLLFVGYNNGLVRMFELFDTGKSSKNMHKAKLVKTAQMNNQEGKKCQLVGFTVLESMMFFVSGSNDVYYTTAEKFGEISCLPDANNGGHHASVHALCVDADALTVFSGGHDHDIKVWKKVWVEDEISPDEMSD